MNNKLKLSGYFAKLSIVFLLLSFLFGCGGLTPSKPIINTFTATPPIIASGESSTLSWTVTDATSVTIDQGIGSVAVSSGNHSVSPTTTTTYTLTATNSAGSVTATTKVTVTSAPPDIKTKTIKPIDTHVDSGYPDKNFIEHLSIGVGRSDILPPGILRAYLKFDLSTIPDNAVVTEAVLKYYQFYLEGIGGFGIRIYEVTSTWQENEITWNHSPTVASKSKANCYIDSSVDVWREWQITDLVQGWLDRSIDNYGIMLKSHNETIISVANFRSSDYGLADKRPKLEIKYYIP